ncbi:MAG: histidinol dehydrogenase, partial [Anaerovoracaceae bacterium]
MRIIKSNQINIPPLIREMKNRAGETDREVRSVVEAIVSDVRDGGDEAVRKYERKFNGIAFEPFEIPPEAMKGSFDHADGRFKQALSNASENIKEYHEQQIQKGYEIQRASGALLGQIIRGLDRVGIYVPGGTAAYP